MIIKIYRNNEQVNEITSTDATEIYKKIAQIYKAKADKRTTKTTIKASYSGILEATETYNQDKTQLSGTTYTYKYYFKNAEL